MRKFFDPARAVLLFNGWGFLALYLAVYLIGWWSRAPTELVRAVFVLLHLFFLTLLFTAREVRRIEWPAARYWIFLFLVLLLPGAYLEYPGDPWEHFRRIFSWDTTSTIAAGEIKHKFSFFLAWTLVGWVPIESRRSALSVYGACSELLVLLAVVALAEALGFTRRWAKACSLLFLVTFGTNVFGLRYYALSSLPIAYVAYVRAIESVCRAMRNRTKTLLSLTFLIPLMICNHVEELLLFLAGSSAILTADLFQKAKKKFPWIIASAVILFLGFCFGVWVKNQHSEWYILRIHYPKPEISSWGAIAVWRPSGRFLDTLGIAGALNLVAAFLLLRKSPRLSFLTIVFPLLPLFPPMALLLSQVMPTGYIFYRLLYGIPAGFCLMLLASEFTTPAVAVGILAMLSLSPKFPWRGRAYFVFHRPSAERALVPLDAAAVWLRDHKRTFRECTLRTDDMTDFFLASQLSRNQSMANRLTPPPLFCDWKDATALAAHLRVNPACGFLIAMREKLPKLPASPVARQSNHWLDGQGDLSSYIPGCWEKTGALLLELGWSETDVPPFYRLYEPPSTGSL